MKNFFASRLLLISLSVVFAFCPSAFAKTAVSATLIAKESFSIPGDSIINQNHSVGNLNLATFEFTGATESCGIYNDSPDTVVIEKGQILIVRAPLALGFIEFSVLNIPVPSPSQIQLYITQPPVGPLDHLTSALALAQLEQCATKSGLLELLE